MQHLKNHLIHYWITFPPDPEAPDWKNVKRAINWLIDEQMITEARMATLDWVHAELDEFRDRDKKIQDPLDEDQAPLGSNPFMEDS